MSDCKCKQPCGPCSNNCPDDGEIIESTILDPEDCNTNCCGKKCSDNCGINIQSTNDCLVVDTSECGVIKLTAECPKPTYVKAGNNVTVKDVTPPDDCYINGGDCDVKGGWEISSTDEKVKVLGCGEPDYLGNLIHAGDGIKITKDCNELKINIDRSVLPDCDYPELNLVGDSEYINLSVGGSEGHTIYLSDKPRIEDNMCMVGFAITKEYTVPFDENSNAEEPAWISTDVDDKYTNGGWMIYTGNGELATADGIKIKQDGHYWVYGQLTVCNNWKQTERYSNLGRALLRVKGDRSWLGKYSSLSTSKHGAYGIQTVLRGGKGISIDQNGTISNNRATISVGEGGGTYEVVYDAGGGIQTQAGFDGPWMTHNIGVFVDLHEGDVITLGYRPQSDMPETLEGKSAKFEIVGANDSSTGFRSLFGGTQLGVVMLSTTLFQKYNSADNSEIFQFIGQ